MTLANELMTLLQSKGADLVAFADLSELSEEARHHLPYGISIGVALNPQIVAAIEEGPTKEYYVEYKRVNQLLDSLAATAAEFLKSYGQRAQRFPATDVGVDRSGHLTRLPHKTVATRAGLGWIGKCALLVTEQFGSALRITTVLTDAELPVAAPVNESHCGECMACVEACPGNAATGINWEAGMKRERLYDVFACCGAMQKLTQERIGERKTICGICIAVCPWTQKYLKP